MDQFLFFGGTSGGYKINLDENWWGLVPSIPSGIDAYACAGALRAFMNARSCCLPVGLGQELALGESLLKPAVCCRGRSACDHSALEAEDKPKDSRMGSDCFLCYSRASAWAAAAGCRCPGAQRAVSQAAPSGFGLSLASRTGLMKSCRSAQGLLRPPWRPGAT